MKYLRIRLQDKLSLLLLAAALSFSALVVKPLEERGRLMLSRISPDAGGSADARVAELYRVLKKEEAPTDWLAKLYGIGRATGIEMQQASYSTQQAAGRLSRYEIVLPVAGSYPQLRDFLQRATSEIPVLSVDQMTLRRESRKDGALNGELRLTLHMVRP